MPFVSYAQNQEDVLLWRALGDVVNGTYIDVGAADPSRLSVTKAFYERGWRGLNVEPLPEQAARLRAERPDDMTVEAAASDHAGSQCFFRVAKGSESGLSTLDPAMAATHARAGAVVEELEVALVTLAELCHQHVKEPVHFLKIAVQGGERAVLEGADLTAVRPWIVLVEATGPTLRREDAREWDDLLLAAGYWFVWFDGLNRFYLAAEHHDRLSAHFTLPINVFDDWIRDDAGASERAMEDLRLAEQAHQRAMQQASQQRDAAAAVLAQVRRQAATLEAECDRLEERLTAAAAAVDAALADAADLRPRAAALDLLLYDLRWDRGPRALKLVLPLARLIRRLSGPTPPRPATAPPRHSATPKLPPPEVSAPSMLVKGGPRTLHPRLQPIADRTREFLMAGTTRRLAELQAGQAEILAALRREAPQGGGGAIEAASAERLLLTLALERRDQA